MEHRRQLVHLPKTVSLSVDAVRLDPPGKDPAGPIVVALEKLADLVAFVGRGVGRIARVGQYVVARIGAHAAVHAGHHGTGNLTIELLPQPLQNLISLMGSFFLFAH